MLLAPRSVVGPNSQYASSADVSGIPAAHSLSQTDTYSDIWRHEADASTSYTEHDGWADILNLFDEPDSSQQELNSFVFLDKGIDISNVKFTSLPPTSTFDAAFEPDFGSPKYASAKCVPNEKFATPILSFQQENAAGRPALILDKYHEYALHYGCYPKASAFDDYLDDGEFSESYKSPKTCWSVDIITPDRKLGWNTHDNVALRPTLATREIATSSSKQSRKKTKSSISYAIVQNSPGDGPYPEEDEHDDEHKDPTFLPESLCTPLPASRLSFLSRPKKKSAVLIHDNHPESPSTPPSAPYPQSPLINSRTPSQGSCSKRKYAYFKASDDDGDRDNDNYRIVHDHSGKKTYQCRKCPQFRTKAKGDMKRHLESRMHKPPSYYCLRPGCRSAPFTRKDALKRHEETVHRRRK